MNISEILNSLNFTSVAVMPYDYEQKRFGKKTERMEIGISSFRSKMPRWFGNERRLRAIGENEKKNEVKK